MKREEGKKMKVISINDVIKTLKRKMQKELNCVRKIF